MAGVPQSRLLPGTAEEPAGTQLPQPVGKQRCGTYLPAGSLHLILKLANPRRPRLCVARHLLHFRVPIQVCSCSYDGSATAICLQAAAVASLPPVTAVPTVGLWEQHLPSPHPRRARRVPPPSPHLLAAWQSAATSPSALAQRTLHPGCPARSLDLRSYAIGGAMSITTERSCIQMHCRSPMHGRIHPRGPLRGLAGTRMAPAQTRNAVGRVIRHSSRRASCHRRGADVGHGLFLIGLNMYRQRSPSARAHTMGVRAPCSSTSYPPPGPVRILFIVLLGLPISPPHPGLPR